METHVIPHRAWQMPEELQAAAARSTEEGDETPDDLRWLRSYVLTETSGEPGLTRFLQCRDRVSPSRSREGGQA